MKLGRCSTDPGFLIRFFLWRFVYFAAFSSTLFFNSCSNGREVLFQFGQVATLAGKNREFGEPFGLAFKNGETYVSDGEKGAIFKLAAAGDVQMFSQGLSTPSAIAFDTNGELIVADSGSHTVKKIATDGTIAVIAGIPGNPGDNDGDAGSSRFNAPVGIAISGDGRIFVSDTYNDRIRLIENGTVRTLAGNGRGYADGAASEAKFDTPLGIALRQDGRLLIADSGNRRLRVLEPDGRVWTLAGGGAQTASDGLLGQAGLVSPTAISVASQGTIVVADGDTIRLIGGRSFPFIETISSGRPGLADGTPHQASFSRPSSVAINERGEIIVADSDNQLIRVFTNEKNSSPITDEEIDRLRYSVGEFRTLQPARWPFDPPNAKRDIAGTLGEIRGELVDDSSQVWFHNGLDIAGGYGETARIIRSERVLDPNAVGNFATLRELVRTPTIGYIHLRLGRDANDVTFGDPRFVFDIGPSGKLTGVRIPRGASFAAGEPIGTLNAMNHVHLIAGRRGSEMNALAALDLPGVADTTTPTIEQISFFDENWGEIETPKGTNRIKLSGRTRIIVRAFDRMDGNPERRRLGLYGVGFRVQSATTDDSYFGWAIRFDRLPAFDAVRSVYARGSKSGATGETVFNYVASNSVDGSAVRDGFLEAGELAAGTYTLRVMAGDYFGNIAHKDVQFEVSK